jgi:hypothetical protein
VKFRWMLRASCVLALLALRCGPPEVFYLWDDPMADGTKTTPLKCEGSCASLPPAGWEREHFLLWTGAEADAPTCPVNASSRYLRGYADLIALGDCDACSCGDPACVLPSGVTANSSICPGSAPGSIHTDFPAPPAWTGACTSPAAVPFNDAKSVEIAAPTVTPCTPVTVPVASKLLPPSWGKYVVTCQGTAYGRCDDSGSSCVSAPDAKFRLCLQSDDVSAQLEAGTCPSDYPERHMIYKNFNDQRSCTPCACDLPTGSDCSAEVSTYADGACTTLISSNVLSSTQGLGCHDNGSGLSLGSMSASWKTNKPGACKPTGGDLVGQAVAAPLALFCCQPLP